MHNITWNECREYLLERNGIEPLDPEIEKYYNYMNSN